MCSADSFIWHLAHVILVENTDRLMVAHQPGSAPPLTPITEERSRRVATGPPPTR
jgi:hypothetical protein